MDQISINIKTLNPKGRLFKKNYQLRYLATGVYLSKSPSTHRFLFEVVVVINFVGLESGQIHTVYSL